MRYYAAMVRGESSQVLSEIFNCLLDCYARGEKDAHIFIDDAEAYEQVVLMAPLYFAKHGSKGHAVWYTPRGIYTEFQLKKKKKQVSARLIR